MELNGSVSGLLHLMGGGDDVEITPVIVSGIKIATFVLNPNTPEEETIDLYAPEGTTSYIDLTDKPTINGTTINGILTTSDLNISYNDLLNKPLIPNISSGLSNPSGGSNGDIYIKLHVNDTPIEHDFTPAWLPAYTWNEVDNPYFDGFVGYSGSITFQGNTSNISKTADEIPIYDSTVESTPENYKVWNYSYYRWASIARSADNKKLYFYTTTDNASYTNQKILNISDDVDGYSGIYYNYNGVWLSQVI